MTQVQKATHEDRIELFAPIIEEYKGKYVAVLSDDSIDRDGEMVGKAALQKIVQKKGYIAAMLDHEHKALNQVGNWENLRMEKLDGATVLLAEPRFFLSNPKAKIVKGMLDEGAKIGISIGAIVKDFEDQKFNGKNVRTFTDLELIEASFVGIPSNRYGRALAVAKSFKKIVQGEKMETEFTQKDLDAAIEKANTESNAKIEALNKKMEDKDSEIAELTKSLEDEKKAVTEKESELTKATDKVAETEKKLTEAEKMATDAKEEAEKAKKDALEKGKLANGEDKDGKAGISDEEAKKSFEEGKLPVMHMGI